MGFSGRPIGRDSRTEGGDHDRNRVGPALQRWRSRSPKRERNLTSFPGSFAINTVGKGEVVVVEHP